MVKLSFVPVLIAAALLCSCGQQLDGTYVVAGNPAHKMIFKDGKVTLETQYGQNTYEYQVKGGKVYTKSGIYPIADNGCISAMGEDYCKGN